MNNNTIKVKVNSLKNYLAHNPHEAQKLAVYFYEEYLKLSKEIESIKHELLQEYHTLDRQKMTSKL